MSQLEKIPPKVIESLDVAVGFGLHLDILREWVSAKKLSEVSGNNPPSSYKL